MTTSARVRWLDGTVREVKLEGENPPIVASLRAAVAALSSGLEAGAAALALWWWRGGGRQRQNQQTGQAGPGKGPANSYHGHPSVGGG